MVLAASYPPLQSAQGWSTLSRCDLSKTEKWVYTPMVMFDKDAFLRALNATLSERLRRPMRPGEAKLLHYSGKRPIRPIAQGIAGILPGEVRVVELVTDELRPREPWKILEPLLTGQTLVLVHEGVSKIPGDLANVWPEFARNPKGYSAQISKDLIFWDRLTVEKAGSLVAVQATGGRDLPREIDFPAWRLTEQDAEEFQREGDKKKTPVTVVGEQVIYSDDLVAGMTWRTDYERAYRIYRRLVNHLAKSAAELWQAVSLADAALRTRDENQILYQGQANNLRPALEEVWGSVRAMRAITLELSGGRHDDDPLPDAYAAALSMRSGGDWRCERERSLYRGQRNCKWRVIPTLYRADANGKKEDVGASMGRVQTFSDAMKSVYPGLSNDQCMAASQHFGKEAGTRTPLIDVTWDALVALFFASDGAVAGDVGMVDHIVVPEWKRLVAASAEDRGFIKVIEVDQVARIAHQRALFLATPDPEAYERYFPYRIWFRQHAGVVFEDEEYEQPISAKSLYPIDDAMQQVLERFAKEPVAKQAPAIAAPETNEVFGAEYLLERARTLAPGWKKWDAFHQDVARTCAELFARGQEWSDDRVMYSLQRWRESLDLISLKLKSGQQCPVRVAMQFALSRAKSPESQSDVLDFARNIWRVQHGTVISTVMQHLEEMLGLTRGQPMTGAICFAGGKAHVGKVISALSKDRRWSVVDLRRVSEKEMLPAIERVRQPAAIVLATDRSKSFPEPLRRLFKVAQDGNYEVMVGKQSLALHPDSRVYLLTWGRSFDTPNEAVEVIDAWDEVDEFDG